MKAELLAVFGDDLMVVNAARVSMAKHHDQFDEESDSRLIRYLAREGHWTPFGQPQAQFRLEAPIFVARQWYRHTIGTVRNEVSRRYVDDEPRFFEPKEWRSRPEGNIKQGSGEPLTKQDQSYLHYLLINMHERALDGYRDMLIRGVAPEQARMILPQTMYTTWIETASLAYWARLCNLRLDSHAQKETGELAMQVAIHMAKAFPHSWAALMDNTHA